MTELVDRIGAALVGLKMPRALEALRAFFTKFDPLRTPSWRGSSSILRA